MSAVLSLSILANLVTMFDARPAWRCCKHHNLVMPGHKGGTGAYVQAVLPVDAGVVWSIAVGGPAGGLGIPNQSRMDAQNYASLG